MKFITTSFVKRMFGVVVAVCVIIAISTVTFHILEGWRVLDAFYYSVVTITTVGYGDLTPTQDASKIAASVLILLSIPLMFFIIGIAADSVFNEMKRSSDAEERRRERIRAAARRKRRENGSE